MEKQSSDSLAESVDDNGMQTPGFGNGMRTPVSRPKKSRRKSVVWDYFIIEVIDPNNSRAFCTYCKKSFAYMTNSKVAGTSHLKRHMLLGDCPLSLLIHDKNQVNAVSNPISENTAASYPHKKRKKGCSGSESIQFDQTRSLHEIARMIILHEYPLHMVEDPGFTDFTRILQPQFNGVSFESVQSECMDIYFKGQQILKDVLDGVTGRVSLVLDLWMSVETTGYAILSGQFVDSDWRLRRRVLSVIMVPFPESEVAFNHTLLSCVSKWGLETRLFFVTLDESFASEAVIGNLSGLISVKDSLTFRSRFVIGRCYARTLSRLVKEAIGSVKEIVEKVHKCVKHVKSSPSHEKKFKELKLQLQVPTLASLVLDDRTRWDTTYHMLSAASELKEVFCCLDPSDLGGKASPTMEEWERIDVLCLYLKLLYNAANVVPVESYPTANVFFCEACQIRMGLIHGTMSPDPFVRSLVGPLAVTFEKYWKDCSIILAMASVMDPRFKFKHVVTNFNKIFGEENGEAMVNAVEENIANLFVEYVALTAPVVSFDVEQQDYTETHEEVLIHDDGFSVDVYISTNSDNLTKSDLEHYFEDAVLGSWSDDFDVLQWWKSNKTGYPILSRMAADLLSIPVATVAPNCVFYTGCTKLDSYRCSLKAETLEALVCAKDWLQCGVQDPSDVSASSVITET